jgi:hypothetical protein
VLHQQRQISAPLCTANIFCREPAGRPITAANRCRRRLAATEVAHAWSLPATEHFLAFALSWLRGDVAKSQSNERNADLSIEDVAWDWCLQREDTRDQHRKWALAAVAAEAGWELVRRGILRPGGRGYPDNNSNIPGRFSLTAWGRQWLAEADEWHFIVMQHGALAQTLKAFENRFGEGFVQRSQQAIRCREADAWLASCAMCGAAAESILLALAIAKSGDEGAVIKEYRTGNGRKKTIDGLVGQQPDRIQGEFRSSMNILSYWRDDAAHGMASPISAAVAEVAMQQLLRLSQFANRHWDELTA